MQGSRINLWYDEYIKSNLAILLIFVLAADSLQTYGE